MRSKNVGILLFLCLAAFSLAREAAARDTRPAEPEWLQQKYAEGWEKIKPGVLRRDIGGGKVETFTFGAEGYQWVIERYHRQLIKLESKYRQEPTDELAASIDHFTKNIELLQEAALGAPAAELVSEGDDGCSYYRLTADAGPLTSSQGVRASSSVYFESRCGVVGTTTAYAHARARNATLQDMERWDDDGVGTQISGQAAISADGSLECFSEAWATVTFSDKSVTLEAVPNYNCPDGVSISGPAQVLTDYYGSPCADVTWTAVTLSGRTDYSFKWFVGVTFEGTGPTLTKRFCGETRDVSVRVTVQDGAGWTAEAPFSTHIQDIGPVEVDINGPVTVKTDYYSPTCVAINWTASAKGGHPGYTYKWYLDSGTTVQATGGSLTKTYCPTATQSVTAKVVVTDSDGHSDAATFPTDIQYIGPLTVSVSGPATATTDYYGPTCVNVTWTANTGGAHPTYTYKWYLSSSTTVQATGNSFTKNYCTTASQSVTVKVIATDSDGHTVNSSNFTTALSYNAAITASITGPATVATNTTTPCANVTWTASAASSGHSGYTYKWYLGTSSIVQGTGKTFTKQYCNTTTMVVVKAIATASDNDKDDVTFTTSITHTNKPTASISGPAEFYVYGSTCQTITWTANVSGGTTPYTYSWTIGTSTTVLSTTSTLSKSVCSAQSIDVKLAVRDAAAQTANATFNTLVYKETACLIGCP